MNTHPPYARKWIDWADRLYFYHLLVFQGRYECRFPGVIYVLSDERQAWTNCKDAYRDYRPRSEGGKDFYIPKCPDDVQHDWNQNYMDWRFWRITCATLLPKDKRAPAFDWRGLARPFVRAVIAYDKGARDRAEELASTLIALNFSSVRGVDINGPRSLI